MKNPFYAHKNKQAFISYATNEGAKVQSRNSDSLKEIQDFILQEGYPCVGAQASVNSNNICIGVFDKMNSKQTAKNLAFGLYEYLRSAKESNSQYLSYIATFPKDSFATEMEFERALWQLLSKLYTVQSPYFAWNEEVSEHPKDVEFSYSFGNASFFLVGLHPRSSRKARRFHIPAIAFNLHDQFEELRAKGRYSIMRDATRKNELQFQGSINPMLSDFGHGLEATQYSGRAVSDAWKCPFNKETTSN